MIRARYGDRRECATCGSDIEYQGKAHGWIDRGGVAYCDESGAARWDQDGIPVPYPHKKHAPVKVRR